MGSKQLHRDQRRVQQEVENIDYIGIVYNLDDAKMIRGREDMVEDLEADFEKFVPLA